MASIGLHILDVGHGNAAVLIEEDHSVVVVDAARGSDLLEFLSREEITRIEHVLLSHADVDHVGGLLGLLALVEAGGLEIGTVHFNSDPRTEGAETWTLLIDRLAAAEQRGSLIYEVSLHTGHTGNYDIGGTHIEVLAPEKALAARGVGWKDEAGRLVTANSMSAVVRFTRGGEPLALLPGDIDDVGLDWLLAKNPTPTAPVVVFPHHGGRPGERVSPAAFATQFCEAVQPDHVMFSMGRGGSTVYPRRDVVDAVRAWRADVHIACTQLSRHCAGEEEDLPGDEGHLSATWSRGRDADRKTTRCCAGTLCVWGAAEVVPGANHVAFVQARVPGAICTI